MNHKAKDKDRVVNQRLKHENQKLKMQLGRLRKQLARVDLETYTNIKEALEAQEREDIAFEAAEKNREKSEDIRKIWECGNCSKDFLRLILLHRPDGDFYLRKCPACSYKTRLKPFTETVKGQETRNMD